jgi:hypothetical protein
MVLGNDETVEVNPGTAQVPFHCRECIRRR